MTDFDLKETRNNLVAKDNRMIQNSRMSLSSLENKAVLYLISKIRPDDEPGKTYMFNCKEFQALLNWNKEASYQNVKIMIQNLGDLSWWIEGEVNGKKKDILVRWFDIVHMDPGTGDIEISFHRDMFPFLVDLQKHLEEDGHFFTTYKLQNIALMKHRYSPRIYELLKSYQYNRKSWTFENGTGSEYDLQRRIADTEVDKKTRKVTSIIPESWSNWAIFKRDVLNPAIDEINKYTDIKVGFEGKKEDIHQKKTRAIRTIKFFMVEKTAPEKRRTDDIIDAEYTIIEDELNFHQMSLEELFFAEHEKSLEEERYEKEIFDAQKMEDEINSSKHQVLYESLNKERNADFNEAQIELLFDLAIKGRVAGTVSRQNWELFATDIITYYFDDISASPEKTKTDLFTRLKDCVKKDYDGCVNKIIKEYAG